MRIISTTAHARITVCTMLTGLILAALILSGRGEFGLNDVTAADDFDDAQAISAACTDPDATGFVPGIAYTITWSAPARGSEPLPSATIALSNGINGDSAPSVVADTIDGGGTYDGTVILASAAPKLKLAGLQCRTTSQSKLEVHGDGSDNTKISIAIQNIADADDNYNPSDQVDTASSASKDVLFGTSGQIATSNLSDGSDNDSAVNGEVTFGGAEANGGSEHHVVVDYTNYNIQAGTDFETLTFTFTGS